MNLYDHEQADRADEIRDAALRCITVHGVACAADVERSFPASCGVTRADVRRALARLKSEGRIETAELSGSRAHANYRAYRLTA